MNIFLTFQPSYCRFCLFVKFIQSVISAPFEPSDFGTFAWVCVTNFVLFRLFHFSFSVHSSCPVPSLLCTGVRPCSRRVSMFLKEPSADATCHGVQTLAMDKVISSTLSLYMIRFLHLFSPCFFYPFGLFFQWSERPLPCMLPCTFFFSLC